MVHTKKTRLKASLDSCSFYTIRMVGNYTCFLSAAAFLFLKFKFSKIISVIPSVSKSLALYQDRHFAEPDLGPNCLHWLSADNTGRQN